MHRLQSQGRATEHEGAEGERVWASWEVGGAIQPSICRVPGKAAAVLPACPLRCSEWCCCGAASRLTCHERVTMQPTTTIRAYRVMLLKPAGPKRERHGGVTADAACSRQGRRHG